MNKQGIQPDTMTNSTACNMQAERKMDTYCRLGRLTTTECF